MLKLICAILCLIAAVNSSCLPYNGGTIGFMDVCDMNFANCVFYGSYQRSCVNFSSGEFYTGGSKSSSYFCVIYSQYDCGGASYPVKDLQIFPWRAYSMSCPWSC